MPDDTQKPLLPAGSNNGLPLDDHPASPPLPEKTRAAAAGRNLPR